MADLVVPRVGRTAEDLAEAELRVCLGREVRVASDFGVGLRLMIRSGAEIGRCGSGKVRVVSSLGWRLPHLLAHGASRR